LIAACLAWVAAAFLPGSASAAMGDCAQPASSGASPTSTDCLFILQTAVFLRTCDPDPCICAPKGSLPVAATDALVCLRRVTGQPVTLSCPCTQSCAESAVPTCGGTCPEGTTCGEDVSSPGECSCLGDCELSEAPTCGGSCTAEGDPSLVCHAASFGVGEGPLVEACQCIPPGLQLCVAANAPECGGICQPGAVCQDQNGTCACVPLPTPGPCAGAAAPACAGTCPTDQICEAGGDGCACVPYTGQGETCFDAQAPVCGGACTSGELCAPNSFFVCECYAPCHLGEAPACDGECLDPAESCTSRRVQLDGSTLEFCACLRPLP